MAQRYLHGEDDIADTDGQAEVYEEEILETEQFEDLVDDFDEDDDLGEEEFEISGCSMREDDDKFDTIMGKLEDIIMDDEFLRKQTAFFRRHCDIFEDTEENKLQYTDIFKEYTEWVEKHLDETLKREVEGFSMEEFMAMLEERKEEVENSDVFDVLLSTADFTTFKEIMLSHKEAKAGKGFSSLQVDVRQSIIHREEEEGGVEMPDLNLSISPASRKSGGGGGGVGYLGSPMKDL